jgi:formate/nitrite transporter FocA (FNT family)
MGGLIFPIGLGMIMMTGAELVTSNFFLCALPILSPQSLVGTSSSGGGQETVSNAIRICAASLAGNAFGSVVVACACAETLFVSEQHSNWIAALAEMKCRLGPGVVFVKAMARTSSLMWLSCHRLALQLLEENLLPFGVPLAHLLF